MRVGVQSLKSQHALVSRLHAARKNWFLGLDGGFKLTDHPNQKELEIPSRTMRFRATKRIAEGGVDLYQLG